VARAASWTAPLLLAAAALRAGPSAADDRTPAPRPPTVTLGLPTPDGVPLWRHGGAHAPQDGAVRWTFERAGSRTFRGRTVDVLRYVARDAEGRALERSAWDQADFLDPSTGEVVAGLDGWGQERYPSEDDERHAGVRACPGR
jgi:hypothetical protein